MEDFLLHLYCVDPSKNLQECLDTGQQYDLFLCNASAGELLQKSAQHRKRTITRFMRSRRFNGSSGLLVVSAGDVSSMYTRRN